MSIRYDYYRDGRGEWRWTAIADNGEPIASSSEGYVNRDDCLHAIDLMKGSGSAAVAPRARGIVIRLGGSPSHQARLLLEAALRSL